MIRALLEMETATPVASVIISLALMLFSGFAMTRLTKLLRLPDVTAYIVVGILLGPHCLGLVPQSLIDGTAFLPDIALAMIAFSTGEFFRLSVLRKNGAKVVIITLLESLLASAAVFFTVRSILRLDLAFSVVLSALAAATAPASTMMTIRQLDAGGDFVDTLLQVVALDDAVGLVAYSAAISIALAAAAGQSGGTRLADVAEPVLVNAGILLLGCVFGLMMKLFLTRRRSTDNRLIISIALIFAFCGICAALDVSPLLGCMSMGTVYSNVSRDEKIFRQLNYFTPPLLLIFFVRSGLSFRLDILFQGASAVGGTPLLTVGALYFLARILGKYAGAYLGCLAAGKPAPVRNYLGLALIPQAGVAIGLAALGARTLGGTTGSALETIILASSVLYELIGPGCAKLSLYLSGSCGKKAQEPEDGPAPDAQRAQVAQLIDQIRDIQRGLPEKHPALSEEELAFLEAAEEQYAAMVPRRYPGMKRGIR